MTVWCFRILLLGLPRMQRLFRFPNISPCNSCSSTNSIFSRIIALALAFFQHPQPLHFIFYLLVLFKKGFLCKQFCNFYFSFYLVWFGVTWTVWFWTSSWRSTWMALCFWWNFWTTIILLCFLQPGMHLPPEVENHFIYFIKPFITIVDLVFFHILLAFLVCCNNKLQDVIKLCQLFFNSNFLLAWIKQVFSGTTFPQKSKIQSLPLILDLKQFLFPSFWW